jgi:hypothetical protein
VRERERERERDLAFDVVEAGGGGDRIDPGE